MQCIITLNCLVAVSFVSFLTSQELVLFTLVYCVKLQLWMSCVCDLRNACDLCIDVVLHQRRNAQMKAVLWCSSTFNSSSTNWKNWLISGSLAGSVEYNDDYNDSALTLLVGLQEGHPAWKKTEWWGAGMVICLEQGADLHMAQLMPLPLTISCFSKIQIGFTLLVPAHLGIPGKGPLNGCVCVCITSGFVESKKSGPRGSGDASRM